MRLITASTLPLGECPTIPIIIRERVPSYWLTDSARANSPPPKGNIKNQRSSPPPLGVSHLNLNLLFPTTHSCVTLFLGASILGVRIVVAPGEDELGPKQGHEQSAEWLNCFVAPLMVIMRATREPLWEMRNNARELNYTV